MTVKLPTLQELACRAYLSQNPKLEEGSFEYNMLQNISFNSLSEFMILVNPELKGIVQSLNDESIRDWYERSVKRMSEQGCAIDPNKSPAFIAQEILQINSRARSLSQAVAGEDIGALRALLSQGQLYTSVRGRCLDQACCMQNFEIIQILAESGPLPDKDRISALKLVIKKHKHRAFDALLPASIGEKDRLDLLLLSIRFSNSRALHRLLKMAPLPEAKIDGLINTAAMANQPKALEILLSNHQISDTLREKIASFTKKKGYCQVTQLLLGRV